MIPRTDNCGLLPRQFVNNMLIVYAEKFFWDSGFLVYTRQRVSM